MRWKLVPVEPTEEMLSAGEGTYWHCGGLSEPVHMGDDQYARVLAAAPPASQDEELVGRVAMVLADVQRANAEKHCWHAQVRAVLKMLEGE